MKGISRESERMSLLVDDLLLLARLDEGRPLERDRVQLDEVVAEAVETAHAVEPERPIELELDPAVVHRRPRPAPPDRRQPALERPCAHAARNTRLVSVRRRNGTAEIAVSDSGPGLDEEHLAHVFERFYRADPSRARASGGVGLGLSIVAAVAEAHGGHVSARSRPGEGATFEIALPLRGRTRHPRCAPLGEPRPGVVGSTSTAESQSAHRAAPARTWCHG